MNLMGSMPTGPITACQEYDIVSWFTGVLYFCPWMAESSALADDYSAYLGYTYVF
jgi:hypothetical protein